MVTIVLVDDHDLVRGGLHRALARHEGMNIVGEAASAAEARAVLNTRRPEVAVIDIRLPDGNGIDLCREVVERGWAGAVVILSMYGDADRLLSARDAGASAFVSKDAPTPEVVRNILLAHEKPDTFHAAGLSDALKLQEDRQSLLTPRESEVLMLLADGLSVSEISRQLVISDSTAKTHIGNIYAKLDAHNRAQALMAALRLGLISRVESDADGPY